MKLYDKIQIIRKARGFSQETFSYKLDVSRQAVSDWENGKSEPKLNNIRDIAKTLNVSFDVLLNENIDLNDEHQLQAALKNISYENQVNVNRKIRYSIYKVAKLKWLPFVVLSLSIVFAILSIIMAFAGIDNTALSGALLLGFAIASSILFFTFLINMNLYTTKGRKYYIGEINSSHFILKALGEVENIIYIPINDIERIELENEKTCKKGNLIVSISRKKHKLIIHDVYKPKDVLKMYEKIVGFKENDDELQIL